MDAYINWSRWVTDCEQCANATELQAGQVRWVCGRCGTDQAVQWPTDVDSIHAALVVRVAPENRNWRQPETVPDLIAENAAHGVL